MSASETTYDAIPEPRVVPSHFFLQTPLSVLHELFSRCGLTCEYTVISRPTGHCSDFVMQASVANLKATGKGCTKRAAKQSAIVHLLKALFRCSGRNSDSSSSTNLSTGEGFPNSAIDALQKFCDVNQWELPTYHIGSKSNSEQGDFVVTCVVKNTAVTGTGASKKLAKKHAAFKMLFYQLSCVNSKANREAASVNSGRKSKRSENNSGIKSKSESTKKKIKKLYQNQDDLASCSKSDGKIDEYEAAKSSTSEMNSEFSFDDDVEVELELNEPRKKSSPNFRKSSEFEGLLVERKQNQIKGKILHKEKLAPEDARQWLSTLLLKNMNLNNPPAILTQNKSDNSDLSTPNNNFIRQSVSSNAKRTSAGADTENGMTKFPICEQIYPYDDVASSDEAMKSAEDLKDPASEPIPKLTPLPANSITTTRSLPEFSADFMDDAILALPQSLSAENTNKAPKSQAGNSSQNLRDSIERSSGGSTNEQPVCQAPQCIFARYFPRFTWIESDMVVLERYAWGTSVYMLPRFLAAVVVVVEILLGLLYLCTDHVSGTELLYTFLVLIFLMFLLRAS